MKRYTLNDERAVGPVEGREALIVYGAIGIGGGVVFVLGALYALAWWLK